MSFDKLNRDWIDISSEEHRTYNFGEHSVRIESPVQLNVSDGGGHRILDSNGVSHYIPSGWIEIQWVGKPNFVV